METQNTNAPIAAQETVQAVPQVGITQGYSSNINNTPYTDTMTPAQAQSIVASAGIDPNQVLSAGNIQQTITNPAPTPDDMLGIRAQLYDEQGVNAKQQAFLNAQSNANILLNNMNARLTGIGSRAVSMSKITGQQAQERLVSQGEIDAANADVANKLQEYQLAKGSADEMFAIRNQEVMEKRSLMSQYPGAKIKFTDSFEAAMKKIDNYVEEKEKESYKKALKAEAMRLGISTKGSRKELEKRIGKQNKSALEEAKKKSDLEIEKIRVDIDRTRQQLGNGEKPESNLVPYYVTQPDGTIQQAFNDDGTPVLIPKDSKVYNTKDNEDTLSFGDEEDGSETSWWNNPNTSIWKPWTWND